MPKIFISYRREDSQHQADRLHTALARRMPRRDIFIDVDNIPVGVDFVRHLDAQVSQCDVLLALIGPGWAAARNSQTGGRRLDDPKDFVRIEIASALKRGIPVAPVLLDGAPLPREEDLPEDLRPLVRRHGVEVRRLTFEADADRLIRSLKLGKQARRATPEKANSARSAAPKWLGPVVGVALLAVVGGGAWWAVTNTDGAAPAASSVAQGGGGGPTQIAETVETHADPAVSQPGPLGSSPVISSASGEGGLPAAAARKEAIRTLQQALKTLGYYSGGMDGTAGAGTRAAAQAFAREQSVAAPDLAGPLADVEAFAAKAVVAAATWSAREAAAWGVAKGANTREPLDAYLREFSNGPNAAAARTRIAEITPAEDEVALFERAKSLLVDGGNFAGAQVAFSNFITKFPESNRAGDAQYFLGESLLYQDKFRDAAAAYGKLIKDYTHSTYAPAGLVKLARSLRLLGSPAESCRALSLMSVNFPKASAVAKQLASQEHLAAGCA